MLNPFGAYIADHRGRTKEIRRARIVAHVSGADWTITLEDTGGVVAATSLAPTITYMIGQLVLVSRISAAGAPNAGFYILGAVDNAMPATPPVTDTHTAETITRIVPDGITLVRGGDAVTVTIYGVELTTAPTYGDADIVDDSAPVITPTSITLSVKATGSTIAAGVYSLTMTGRTLASFFRVTVPAEPAAPTGVAVTDGTWDVDYNIATDAVASWDAVSGATGYNAYISDYLVITNQPGLSCALMTFCAAGYGTRPYDFQVSAIVGGVEGALSASVSFNVVYPF